MAASSKEESNNSDIIGPNTKGLTPLHYLFCDMHGRTVNKEYTNKDDKTDIESINILKALGSNINAKTTWEELTALHLAVKAKRSVPVIQCLFEAGADVNAMAKEGFTPLGYVVKSSQNQIKPLSSQPSDKTAEFLIKNGAEVNVGSQISPFLNALITDWTELVIYMINNTKCDIKNVSTAPVNRMGYYSPDEHDEPAYKKFMKMPHLHIAIKNRNIKIIKCLLKTGASIDCFDANNAGRGALHTAIYSDCSVEIIKTLIDAKAHVNAVDKNGCTPLYYAIYPISFSMKNRALHGRLVKSSKSNFVYNHQQRDIIQELIDNGAKMDIDNKDGYTLLHMAVHFRQTDIVQLLLNHLPQNFKIDTISDKNLNSDRIQRIDFPPHELKKYTPLQTAVHYGDLEIVTGLLKAGASVHVKDHKGNTVLHQAMMNDNKEIGSYIMKHVLKNIPAVQPKS